MARLETEYRRLETVEDDPPEDGDVMLHVVHDSGRGKSVLMMKRRRIMMFMMVAYKYKY